MLRFKHLKDLNVTYNTHFKHSMSYSLQSLKASYYFFIHSIYPDIYKDKGSLSIKKLNNTLHENFIKYKNKDINNI
jgi:hypothetical protein